MEYLHHMYMKHTTAIHQAPSNTWSQNNTLVLFADLVRARYLYPQSLYQYFSTLH